jgi:aminopeptidase YwaD
MAKGPAPKRSVAFVAFAGEEQGQVGSTYYVAHLPPGQGRVVAMVNLDMVGRLRERKLQVLGMSSAKEWRDLVQAASTGGLAVDPSADVHGPGDQTPFQSRRIPAVFLSTGEHDDLHRPSDTAEKLNFDGIAAIAQLGYRLVRELGDRQNALAFVPTESKPAPEPRNRSYGPELGILPDFSDKVPGVLLTGVRPGSPAQQAGLMANDVIVKFGTQPIRNVQEFGLALRQKRPGDSVKVTVVRGDKEVTVQAKLGSCK